MAATGLSINAKHSRDVHHDMPVEHPKPSRQLSKLGQVDSEVVRRGQGVGVVVAEHPAAVVRVSSSSSRAA
jgi:hypothetical protein